MITIHDVDLELKLVISVHAHVNPVWRDTVTQQLYTHWYQVHRFWPQLVQIEFFSNIWVILEGLESDQFRNYNTLVVELVLLA